MALRAPGQPAEERDERRKSGKAAVSVNLQMCRYPVVRNATVQRGWRVSRELGDDWNVIWCDTAEVLKLPQLSLGPLQWVNHFPGMQDIGRKDFLAHNLKRLRKRLPEAFAFFPQTYCLPNDFEALAEAARRAPQQTFISKPRKECQGRGICLLQPPLAVQPTDQVVVQEYLARPLLLDGFKFDLRVYALVASVEPLEIYIYEDGLARFCTEPYAAPSAGNLAEAHMHLTNFSINRRSQQFDDCKAEDQGSKRSLSSVLARLREAGHDDAKLWRGVQDIIVKTLLAVQPQLSSAYGSFFPGGGASRCFEILGFDVIIDEDLRPLLLEVNHAPSLGCGSPLDARIKRQLVDGAFDLLRLSAARKCAHAKRQRKEWKRRLWRASIDAVREQRDARIAHAQALAEAEEARKVRLRKMLRLPPRRSSSPALSSPSPLSPSLSSPSLSSPSLSSPASHEDLLNDLWGKLRRGSIKEWPDEIPSNPSASASADASESPDSPDALDPPDSPDSRDPGEAAAPSDTAASADSEDGSLTPDESLSAAESSSSSSSSSESSSESSSSEDEAEPDLENEEDEHEETEEESQDEKGEKDENDEKGEGEPELEAEEESQDEKGEKGENHGGQEEDGGEEDEDAGEREEEEPPQGFTRIFPPADAATAALYASYLEQAQVGMSHIWQPSKSDPDLAAKVEQRRQRRRASASVVMSPLRPRWGS